MYAVPIISTHRNEQRASVGTGFFLNHNENLYFLTNRHNVKTHEYQFTVFDELVDHTDGANYQQIWLLPYPFRSSSGGANLRDLFKESILQVDISSDNIFEAEDFDIAAIPLTGFSPSDNDFHVFNELVDPDVGTTCTIDGYHIQGTDMISNVTEDSLQGKITQPVDPVNIPDNSKIVDGLSYPPPNGMSGSPVRIDDKLCGIMSFVIEDKRVFQGRHYDIKYTGFYTNEAILDIIS